MREFTAFTMRVPLLYILCIFLLSIWTVDASRKGYMIRKNSRLEQQHRRSLHEWRRAYLHRHQKSRSSDKFEDFLTKMDSFIRPRFG
ncbi:hypothetical protein M3Y95_00038200 [Aphelenchoides besseyi]|nr:hypothetical protein M3Y95_00038200 [Aphelenchoides besseyi]